MVRGREKVDAIQASSRQKPARALETKAGLERGRMVNDRVSQRR